MDPQKITRIGKYEITATLGRGGMGVVYRAQDPRMGRQVAIKTVTEDFIHDEAMLERFYREAEKTGMLKHPNIVTVYDLGEHDGFPYIVMEYIEGDPLDKLIRTNAPMPLVLKLRVMEQVCSALSYAHQHDMVHRDVKPANVILQPDGNAKLLDFGIARQEKRERDLNLTVTGSVIGTVPYMAPERLQGAPLDGRSDIFAAGVLLYQLLTGELPFSGEELVLVRKLLNDPHPPLSNFLHEYPPELDRIVAHALAKNPADRYSTAEEMAADLAAVIETAKAEHVEEMIGQAERLSQALDFVGARNALLNLLKLDGQNTQARRLLAEVQQHLTQNQRASQARELTTHAETMIDERRLEDAIALLEQAAKLVPDDKPLSELLERTRKQKYLNEQIDGYLRRADSASRAGDYSGAQSIVAKALELDRESSRVRAAHSALLRQVEEAGKRAQARGLVEQARAEIKARRFREGIELLHQAEGLDSSQPEIQTMLNAAEAGLRNERRRLILDQVEQSVASAVTEQDTQAAIEAVNSALDRLPSDPLLLRYRAQLDLRKREHEERRLVDETVQQCRARSEASPREALAIVNQALLSLPASDRLLSLKLGLEERIARLEIERTRGEHLENARAALGNRDFAAAVQVLSACAGELSSPEIKDLLEFASKELAQQQRRELVAKRHVQAQTLMREGDFAGVVELLEPLLIEAEDTGLRAMTDQAKTLLRERADQWEAAMAALKPAIDAEDHEIVLRAVEGLPEALRKTEACQQMLRQTKAAYQAEWDRMRTIGALYAALESSRPVRDWKSIGNPEAGSPPPSASASGMIEALAARRSEVANRKLAAAAADIEAPGENAPKNLVADLVDNVREYEGFAASKPLAQWNAVINDPSRFRQKRPKRTGYEARIP